MAAITQAADTSRSPDDPSAKAIALLDDLFDGDDRLGRHDFSNAFARALPPRQLATLAGTLEMQLGELESRAPPRSGCAAGHPIIWQRLHFEQAELDARVSFDAEGRIAGLFVVPPEEASPCRDDPNEKSTNTSKVTDGDTRKQLLDRQPQLFQEQAITVGAKEWPLPGILTRATAVPEKAVIVLVHGSGPHDADETLFGNKPFRDIAHGLARHGVATLRYVKRSREHAARLQLQAETLTVREETIDDAVAAVAWLRSRDGMPETPVFVLGHSLGGFVGPRIAKEANGLAGLIVMAGSSRPLEDLVLEQVRYLAPSQSIPDAQITMLAAQRDRVKALARGETVDGPLLLNLPAAYWQDLSRYDPITTARALPIPMLILQGERDYQVTMADLAGWRHGLGEREDVKIRTYPRLNHLFIAGDGPSLPDEYMRAGQLDAAVINDIAAWVLATVAVVEP